MPSSDADSKKPVSYTGVVLYQDSADSLRGLVPEGWDASKTCHHCTLTMGPWKGDPELLGKKITLQVTGFVSDDKVCAVGVSLPDGLQTKGPPHVTVAVTGGGKPFHAGKLDYGKMEQPPGMPGTLTGVVIEVPEGNYDLADAYISDGLVVKESVRGGSKVIFERWQRLAGLIK